MPIATAVHTEADRLFQRLRNAGWTFDDCALYAPLTFEINQLKKAQNALILAHSYQTPDIMYGVADFVGDSYGLSQLAAQTDAEKIIFCSVHFMAETAKLLNPEKEVLIPASAGCSLAESINPQDVRDLRSKYPDAGVVCYINTTAEVKAECDVTCTSSNALQIIEAMPQNEIIFLPDELMAKNLMPLTSKKIIPWKGRCIVHETFTVETVRAIREKYPHIKILAHPECTPSVVSEVDLVASTTGIVDYVKKHGSGQYMLVTECGITDRMKVEMPQAEIIGTCSLCPYMKSIMIRDVLAALKNPREEQFVKIDPKIFKKARATIDRMFEMSRKA